MSLQLTSDLFCVPRSDAEEPATAPICCGGLSVKELMVLTLDLGLELEQPAIASKGVTNRGLERNLDEQLMDFSDFASTSESRVKIPELETKTFSDKLERVEEMVVDYSVPLPLAQRRISGASNSSKNSSSGSNSLSSYIHMKVYMIMLST